MTLSEEERSAIVKYRIERAYASIIEAEYVCAGGFWNLGANRLYYAAFYICEALLLHNKISTSSHSGMSRMISLHFVRPGIISKEDSKLLTQLFRMRQTGDYDDMSDWTEVEVVPMIPVTKGLVKRIEDLILSDN